MVGDTIPGKQQRTAVDLPVLRREAPPEVRMEVVQGGPGCEGSLRLGLALGLGQLGRYGEDIWCKNV